MMDDLISRQQAIDKINERQRKLIYCFGFENDMVKIMDIAKSIITIMPSAQPERKTGRWIESNPQDSKLCRLMTCSECGKAYIVNINVPYEDWTEAHKFCVECGADMRGDKHETD